MPDPLISVVIPAFNATATVAETITSVLRQSLTAFEVIVVNDGSADDLEGTLQAAQLRDPRIRVVKQDNQGLASARNRGLGESQSDFVAFLDADDVWHPRFLQALFAALTATTDAPFAYALSYRFDELNRLIRSPKWRKPPRHDFLGLLTLNSVGSGSAALFRKSAVVSAGGFDATLRERGKQGAEDWKLCLRLARQHAPILIPEYLVGYRLTAQSMSQSNPQKQLAAVCAVLDDIRAEFPDTPARYFADAHTLMNGWLTTAFFHQRAYGTIAQLFVQSYLKNPLWFRSRELRVIHWQKLMSIFWDMRGRTPMADIEENGVRPFAFLARH